MYENWEMTPWYHVARWFGYDVRRFNNNPLAGGWEYGYSQVIARQALKDAYEAATLAYTDADTLNRRP